MASVEILDVHKTYGGPEEAVKGISFTCKDGEFMVLLGPSGCGKTTTLRMITGLESITRGIIKIGDRVVNDLTPRQRNVAMAFETYALYPPLTAYENIAFPLQVMKRSKREIDRRVRDVAEALSITDILDMHPDELAGGQKQRVSLARALVREPTVFLMDEPLSHVDADVRYRARAEIKHIQASTGATVIYVTHDQIEAVALADRVVVMDLGVIQQIGSPSELYFTPANLFVAGFIGEPPMNMFRARLELAGGKLHLVGAGTRGLALHYDTAPIHPASLQTLGEYSGRELVVGVRPQKLTLRQASEASGDGALHGRLLVHEFLGKEGIAQVEIDDSVMECMTPPELAFDRGDPVGVSCELVDIHFFDPATSARIDCEARTHGNPGA